MKWPADPNPMTAEAMRIAMAEALGTLACPGCGWPTLECRPHDHKAPNYPGDLNAMREAEMQLTDQEYHMFTAHLSAIAWREFPSNAEYLKRLRVSFSGSAMLRAEAWCYTKGIIK